ncbi:ATP-binding cassette domain-containing protein, partial [Deinococcus sp.]|uniref:ABC-F family ATP-binding cassette domain-containing protein n=1 Tax=Deinococcus sp. TaxID=47478 RepID=UPI0025F112B5
MLLALEDVQKDYGAQPVLTGVSLQINPGDRIGLVGRNGAGKTTLLRLLLGSEKPDAGVIRRGPGVRVGNLTQDPSFAPGSTVHSILEAAFHELDALEAELEQAARMMESPQSIEHHAELLEHYGRRGGFERRSRRDAVTLAFGFRGREHDLSAGLSGGERTRLGLAALIVENPDVLLLDEPTNHLDLDSIAWLEELLINFNGSIIAITHDRAFLDQVATVIVELDRGKLRSYPGNFAQYLIQKEDQMAQEAVIFAKADKLLAQEEVWIRKGV